MMRSFHLAFSDKTEANLAVEEAQFKENSPGDSAAIRAVVVQRPREAGL
jgi:hypothetical protein